jgi:hypothetical protein
MIAKPREPMTISFKMLNSVWLALILSTVEALAQMPSAGDGGGATVIVTLHAEGAQIYECKPDRSKAHVLTWQFREPIATLMIGGQSVGRHYQGPSWSLVDGGEVRGKVITSKPGATANDIPWLEIEVVERRNEGILSDATNVERVNTKGGMTQGQCEKAGEYISVPYAADYLFLHKG